MKKKFLMAVVCCAAMGLVSCSSTRLYHGTVYEDEPMVKVNSTWNGHLLGGLVPLGSSKLDVDKFTGGAENYVIKTNTSFWNVLVSGVTFGIYTPTQTKAYIPARDAYQR